MKKKLIAIVASLAMVATLVPATAFAAESNGVQLDRSERLGHPWTAVGLDATYKTLKTAGNEDNIWSEHSGGNLTLNGVLPYNVFTDFSTTDLSLNAGNYIGLDMKLPAAETNYTWYMKIPGQHKMKTGHVYNTTDLIKIGNSAKVDSLIAKASKTTKSFEFYQLNDSAFAADGPLKKNTIWFGHEFKKQESDLLPDAVSSAVALNDIDVLESILKLYADKTKTATLTVDMNNLTLLSKEDTDALGNFVDAVAEIAGDTSTGVTILDVEDYVLHGELAKYERHVIAAQVTYDRLTDDQKAIIASVKSQEKAHNYKKAYEALQFASQNVDSASAIPAIEKAIKELPKLPASFQDKAAIDAIKAPLDDILTKYEALNETGKAKVNNKEELKAYEKDYNAKLKAYVDALYADAAKIDTEAELSDADLATIKELQAYVEGSYIPTRNIAGYTAATYDKLVAAAKEADAAKLSLENAVIAEIANVTYTGSAVEPKVAVTLNGTAVPEEAYELVYSNNTNAGTAKVTVVAKSGSTYTGSTSKEFTIDQAVLTSAMVKNLAAVTYTGKAIKPAVEVASGVDYTVAYNNNTAVGKATATITGSKNYKGTITKNFIIKPAKESITSKKAGKKSLTVAYNAQTGAKYRIVYSPAKGQAKAVNTTATKKTIKSLKSGKTYKVKVRAYKVIDGKTYNGYYSDVQKVKVK